MIHVNIRNIFNFEVNAYCILKEKNIVICFKILIELICFKMLGVINTKHINSNEETQCEQASSNTERGHL
jgi:hypothetical protein